MLLPICLLLDGAALDFMRRTDWIDWKNPFHVDVTPAIDDEVLIHHRPRQ